MNQPAAPVRRITGARLLGPDLSRQAPLVDVTIADGRVVAVEPAGTSSRTAVGVRAGTTAVGTGCAPFRVRVIYDCTGCDPQTGGGRAEINEGVLVFVSTGSGRNF